MAEEPLRVIKKLPTPSFDTDTVIAARQFIAALPYFFRNQGIHNEDKVYLTSTLIKVERIVKWWAVNQSFYLEGTFEVFANAFLKEVIPQNYVWDNLKLLRHTKQKDRSYNDWRDLMKGYQLAVGKDLCSDVQLAREMLHNMEPLLQLRMRSSRVMEGTGVSELELKTVAARVEGVTTSVHPTPIPSRSTSPAPSPEAAASTAQRETPPHIQPRSVLRPTIASALLFDFLAFDEIASQEWERIVMEGKYNSRYQIPQQRPAPVSVPRMAVSSPVAVQHRQQPSPTPFIRLPPLTQRQRQYLSKVGGCYKCRKTNLAPIQGQPHGSVNCPDGYATVDLIVPASFVEGPVYGTPIARLNAMVLKEVVPEPKVELSAEEERYMRDEEDEKAYFREAREVARDQHNAYYELDSDSECVNLPFPLLDVCVGALGVLGRALADTGASESFISDRLVVEAGLVRVRLGTPRVLMLAIKGREVSTIITHGALTKFALADGSWTAPGFRGSREVFFKIVPNLHHDIILGNPFLQRHKLTPTLWPFPRLLRYDAAEDNHYDLLSKRREPLGKGEALPPLPLPTKEEERLLALNVMEGTEGKISENVEEEREFERRSREMRAEFADVFPANIPNVSEADSSVRHHIKLVDTNIAHNLRGYPVPPRYREAWRKLIDEHVAAGRIRPSCSPFASPSFIIPKKDPTAAPRWLNDYRRVNTNTIKDRTPLPLTREILAECSNAKYWGKMDMTNSFFQTRMAEEDIEKTAVRTPWGLYEWVVMPMGLCNAPATHQRRVNEALGALNGTICFAYIDDIVVFADTLEQHTVRIRQVLEALRKGQLYCSQKKTELFTSEISFLGHVISRRGLEVDPEKVQKILDWPAPGTAKELRGFLGLVQYLRNFIVDLATHTSGLTHLTKKGLTKIREFWGPAEESHFEAIKRIVTSLPCLAPIDHTDGALPLFVMSDASKVGVGAVLLQGEDWKTALPIGFYSRQYIAAETHYPTHEQELLAIVAALKHWKMELLGVRFVVLTDHETLTRFQTQKDLSKRQCRWVETLADYNYVIKYVPGEQNTVADAMSRYSFGRKGPILSVSVISSTSLSPDVVEGIKASYTSDPICVQMLRNLKSIPGVTLENGLIYTNGRLFIPQGKVLKEALLHDAHDALGHLGFRKTLGNLCELYNWPRIGEDVKDYVGSCDNCQRNKARTTKVQGKLHSLPVPRGCMTDIALDFVGPLQRSPNGGFDTILTITDRLSGYVRLIPSMSTDGVEETAGRIYDGWHRLFGMPERMVSDRDKIFVSKLWRALHTRLGIKLQMSSAFHPETDGRSERTNKTVGQILRSVIQRNQKNWHEKLADTEYAINVAENVSTGMPPFKLVLGYIPSLVPRSAEKSQVLGVEEMLATREQNLEDARTNLLLAKVRQAEQSNGKRGEEPEWKVGDEVMVDSRDRRLRYKSNDGKRSGKFFPRFDGPCKIIKIYPEQSKYRLQLGAGDKSFNTFHTSKLKTYHRSDATKFPDREPEEPEPVIIGGEEEYEVERIEEERKQGRGKKYLVKWKGYRELSWELRSHLVGTAALEKWEKDREEAVGQAGGGIAD